MKTVYTQEELKEALKAHEPKILCKGDAAKPFIKKRKQKKGAIIAGIATAVLSAAAIPFTAGASAIGLLAGGAVAGLTATISATELAIILGITCGTALTAYGIHKGCKIKVSSNGTEVEIEPQYDK